MTTKKFYLILLIFLTLSLGVYFLNRNAANSASQKRETLLQGLNISAVSKIQISEGTDKIEIINKDQQWIIPAKDNYPAEAAKVNALLLKLSDLPLSQKLPADSSVLDKLGLTDEAVTRGFTKISLLIGDTEHVVRLGEGRKGKEKGLPLAVAGGQFIRIDNLNEVYVIQNAITLNVGANNWIDTNLLNILSPSIFSVSQTVVKNGAELENLFELISNGQILKESKKPLELKGKVPEGKTLQASIVAQVQSLLENLRISDVFNLNNAEVNSLNFDYQTKFETIQGLVYLVETAVKAEKYFLKVSAIFSPELVEKINSTNADDSKVDSTKAESANEDKNTALKFSNKEDADKITMKLKEWIFEVPAYTGKKFRFTKNDLF